MEINITEVDREIGDMQEHVRYMVQAYFFQLKTIYKPFIKALGLTKGSEWAYLQTLKRLELLSGYLEGTSVFDPADNKIDLLKKRLEGCVHQVNTLKELLSLQKKNNNSVAFKVLEDCFQRCFVQVLRRRFDLNLHDSKLKDSFKDDTAFIKWYEKVFTNSDLLAGLQAQKLSKPLLEKILIDVNHLCKLYKRESPILYGS